MTRSRSLRIGVSLSLISAWLVALFGAAIPAASQTVYTYSNGIQLSAATSLPIFLVSPLPITHTVTLEVAQLFGGIYDRSNPHPEPGEDQVKGLPRFTYLNEQSNTLLEQFSATGGFYAYNPNRAFGNSNPTGGSTPSANEAQRLACGFLAQDQNQKLLPAEEFIEVPGVSQLCDVNELPYAVSTEWLTSQSATSANSTDAPAEDIPLRVMVEVPIVLHTNSWSPNDPAAIPFGGPGGHISMIFYNPPASPESENAQAPSLDPHTPGLQAIAMPAFGRSFTDNGLVPLVDPAAAQAQVLEQVMDAFPGGTNIHVPVPALKYYLTDASTPQDSLEPVLEFAGVTVDVDGVTQFLKDIILPAAESGPGGLGPTVEISSPTNGSLFMPGGGVNLGGNISDGKPPYSYAWQLADGTSLTGGTLNSPGLLPLVHVQLPLLSSSKSIPNSLVINLIVTDADGITRQDQVSLQAPLVNYLPTLLRGTAPTAVQAGSSLRPEASLAPDYIYTFGVEYGSDYPPYGPGGSDLAGVPPDANGLSSRFFSLGWPRIFNWYNSLAWERDWRDCSLGGSDCTYGVDRADFVYYSGHGNNGGLAVPSNNHDSSWFDGEKARYQNARWIGFSSCLTLRAQWSPASQAPIRRWFGAFQGAHMLMGFNSLMADIAFGGPLVDNMRLPTFFGIEFPWAQRTIAEAWVQTAFQMNAGKPAYIYAWRNGVDPSQEKLPKVNDPPRPRPYPVQWFYWVWWDD
jgi:hypothetical protein